MIKWHEGGFNVSSFRTPLNETKCDFNKVAKQLYWNCTSAWVFSCKFAAYFQNIFFSEHLWTAASESYLSAIYVQYQGFFLSHLKNLVLCDLLKLSHVLHAITVSLMIWWDPRIIRPYFRRLTHFSLVPHFYTPWKRQKTEGFLTFSGSIEMWHWTKMR